MDNKYIKTVVVYINGIKYEKLIYFYKEEYHLYSTQKIHREDGPAILYKNGNKAWLKNGELHREDGPAVENFDGTKHYWLNGVYYPDVNSPEELLLASIIK